MEGDTSRVVIDDPDLLEKNKQCSTNGRIYLGEDYAEKQLTVIVKVRDDE